MLSVQRRAALAMRLQEDNTFTKQAAMEKVAAYKGEYGWLWPVAAQNDPEVADMQKEAFLGMAARFLAGAGRAGAGAVRSAAGRAVTRFSRAGGAASRAGQKMVRAGEQTVRRGRAQMAQSKRSRNIGLSQRQADVLMAKGHTGTSAKGAVDHLAKKTTRRAAVSGNRRARKKIQGTLQDRATASFKPTVGERMAQKGLGSRAAAERGFAKNVDKQWAKKEVGRARQGDARTIYGEYAPQELKRSGMAARQQGLLEAATKAPAAAKSVGSRLKGAWNVLSGRGRTVTV